MLGKPVLYNVRGMRDECLPRVGIINEVNEDGSVGISIFTRYTDSSHPLDYPLKRYPKVKFGDGLGECQLIDEGPHEESKGKKDKAA
jgi:hypothetical protein